ncbi:hypothetical protein [Brevibacillus laterosporus]|uniref:hypothetical protein n=1 Tax=Brevibacillus laterosporus TaxID=1465 RepID=UPI0018CFBDB0|nr:hypothetical protein [Brevibacillus laterosporus]MCG7316171.1 hypothetical protein [Brevibacillus laterosporus]
MTPNLFTSIMYPTISLDESGVLKRILDVFESDEKITPTQWGDNETVKIDYDHSEIIDRVIEHKASEIYLHRNKAVKYTGKFDTYFSPRSYLDFEFHKSMPKKFWPIFFEVSDQLADIVKPRYGVTHIFWPPSIPWETEHQRYHRWMNLSAAAVPVKFLPNGPLGVGMRTYFGGHILEMFGREFLGNTPAVVTELDWGGIRIDLIEKPWEADFNQLLENWFRVMEYLASSGVVAIPSFDEDRMGVSFCPNSAWQQFLKS